MTSPYIGEIRLFAGTFAPAGWRMCDGALLPVSQNQDLFNAIGNAYGGDGVSTFAVPDLRGRAPVHIGTGPGQPARGEKGGSETVSLAAAEMPPHSHPLNVALTPGDSDTPGSDKMLATMGPAGNGAVNMWKPYDGTSQQPLAVSITVAGNSSPHDNMQPSLALSFIIALEGVIPS